MGEADERQDLETTQDDELSLTATATFVGELAEHRRWIVDARDWMVRRDGLGQHDRELPAWSRQPAVTQLRISTPEVLRAFRDWNAGKPYAEQVKPFSFLLAAHRARILGGIIPRFKESLLRGISHLRRKQARARWEKDFAPHHFRLIAPFERDPSKWTEMTWYDRWTGRPFQITAEKYDFESEGDVGAGGRVFAQNIQDVLISYLRNRESKSLDPHEDVPCMGDSRGLLRRRLVISKGDPFLIGKEANMLEERRSGLRSEADSTNVYGRICAGCGKQLPNGSNPRRRYHEGGCEDRAYRKRKKVSKR